MRVEIGLLFQLLLAVAGAESELMVGDYTRPCYVLLARWATSADKTI